jgi:transposase
MFLAQAWITDGYSKDSRPDCLQVCPGLMVTDDGMPLGYEVFNGNTYGSKTVEQIIRAVKSKYGQSNHNWGMDRGMVIKDNLRFVLQCGGSYIMDNPSHLNH